MAETFLPATAEEVIELLDETFRNECARLTDSEREIFHKAGQRSVVEWLKDLKTRTEEQQLNSIME